MRRRCAHCIHGMICVAQTIKVGHAALSSSLFLLHVTDAVAIMHAPSNRVCNGRCCHFIFFAVAQKANRETRICLRLVFNFLSIIQFIVFIALFGHPLLFTCIVRSCTLLSIIMIAMDLPVNASLYVSGKQLHEINLLHANDERCCVPYCCRREWCARRLRGPDESGASTHDRHFSTERR